MKEIIELATSFINEHWDELSPNLREKEMYNSKEKTLKQCQNMPFASWVILEAMCWGCKTNYLKEYRQEVESENTVIKIDEKYFMYDHASDSLKQAFPKTKQVLYFE